jgi:hypothetical protein
MKSFEQFTESQSPDPVIREMARMASRILGDTSITKKERSKLILRLEAEYHAYKAWNKQYASYFRTPRPRHTNEDRQASNNNPMNGRKR